MNPTRTARYASLRRRCLLPGIWVCWLWLAAATVGIAESRVVTIVYTSDGNSVLQNCGCASQNLGGLERRASLFKQLRASRENVLFFDSGDFLSWAANWERDSVIVDLLATLDYDAIALGDQEFLHGPEFFDLLLFPSRLPLVTTNVTIAGQSPGARTLIVQAGGIRVGVVSALSAEALYFVEETRKRYWTLAEAIPAVRKAVAGLRNQVDLIVCLSHLGKTQDRVLARACPDIDVICGAHSKDFLVEPLREGNTWIVQGGAYGEYVGVLELRLDDTGTQVTDAQLLPLHAEIVPDAAVLLKISHFENMMGSGSGMAAGAIPTIPPAYIVAPSFQCQRCHEPQWEQWTDTRHAHAIEALVKSAERRNPECLSCHTTGFGRMEGFTRDFNDPNLASVGCTDCHLTPAIHIAEPTPGEVVPVTTATCTRCHNPMNSPDFDFASYRAKVIH